MTRRRLSTHDQGAEWREPLHKTTYAAIEFEAMVRKAKADGVITQTEAMNLTAEHARLQRNSKEALRRMLADYGYKKFTAGKLRGDPAAKLAEYISHGIKSRKLPSPQTTDHKRRKIPLPPTPDIDYHTKGIGLSMSRPKISQKVTWLSIVGPAVIASLLGVLGVI